VTLHITNGDHAADKLRSFVGGPVTLACDVLHEGPCPPVDGDAWHEVRAHFLAGPGRPVQAVKASLATADRTVIDACDRGDEIALWFEHDLFDQLELIRVLDLIARPPRSQRAPASRTSPHVSLICIDRFPGVERFIGLGQLTPDQLATLNGTGVAVTAGHLALATEAWRAFRSPDPRELLDLARRLSPARNAVDQGAMPLPFLGGALLRFLAEYPSVDHGLSHTEALALEALLDGPAPAGALFAATQAKEMRPFLGDSTFFDTLQRLAAARVPLVTIARGSDEVGWPDRRVALTAPGRDVLARTADHLRLNGIDLWRGGVHLAGANGSPWRWDAGSETLVS